MIYDQHHSFLDKHQNGMFRKRNADMFGNLTQVNHHPWHKYLSIFSFITLSPYLYLTLFPPTLLFFLTLHHCGSSLWNYGSFYYTSIDAMLERENTIIFRNITWVNHHQRHTFFFSTFPLYFIVSFSLYFHTW